MERRSRKNPRMKEYDYATPGYYFVTICTDQKKPLFSEITQNENTVYNRLNPFGKAVEMQIEDLSKRILSIHVHKYVVMPNHLHLIIEIGEKAEMTLSDVICVLKSLSVKQCHRIGYEGKIFQNSFHDHIIRNQADYERIWNYIDGNPIKWREDCFYIEERESAEK